MGKDYNLQPHKLGESIVLDSIGGINQLKERRELFGAISGGMAVSSYLPQEEVRDTVDLDYNLFWGGTATEYWSLANPLLNFLHEKGYSYNLNKRNSTWDICLYNEDDSFLIQHQRRSSANFKKNRESFEREFSNLRRINREGLAYDVLSPEDLVVRKVGRMLNFSDKYGIDIPCGKDCEKIEEKIKRSKERLVSGQNNDEDIISLRINHDIRDIIKLGYYAGINPGYLDDALRDRSKSDEDFGRKRDCADNLLQ